MPSLETQGISLYYELHGEPSAPPVLLITGLGGVGKSWGEQVPRFAGSHYVVLPDQRGTGQTTHAQDGYTTQQLAADMAALVDHLRLGPVHVVGASTGGAYRLGEIRTPTLVTCGTHNFCTTLALSEEIAACIPGAELVTFDDAGELIELEQPEKYFQTVSRFIDSHS
jgi:pimeloyl-ACP methyl ester carboxylesterase